MKTLISRLYLQICTSLVVVLLIPVLSLVAADRPNILWLTCEDIGPQLGCYGDGYARTPHLDALAQRGQLFLHAWSNAPVCAPARTTIISGMYPTSTGSEHMRSGVPMPAGTKMFPQYLREAGYYCTNHHKEDYNLAKPEGVWDVSGKKAHWRNRAAGQPFFAVFNFESTHESQVRKPGHQLQHDPALAPVPPYHPDTPEVRHDWAQYYDNITTMDGQCEARLRELEKDGLAEDTIVVFFGDHGAGMPRHKRMPTASGLRVPLIVYFPPKWQHLAPQGYAPGQQSRELVAFVDLAPTMLSIIGLAVPDYLQGRAFCGSLRQPEPPALYGFRGRMDERPDLMRSVTDGRYVYLRHYQPVQPLAQYVSYQYLTPTMQVWQKMAQAGTLNAIQRQYWEPKPVEALFDLKNDPWEVENLAQRPEHAANLERLRQLNDAHLLRIRDLGFIPEAERHRIAQGRSPRDVFAKDEAYPIKEVLALATLASDTRAAAADPLPLITALTRPHAALRYWAAVGLRVRGEVAVQTGTAALRRALQDESPSVRIAAADGLATYGAQGGRAAALAVLLREADLRTSELYAAVEALNVLDLLPAGHGPPAEAIQDLPRKTDGISGRYDHWIPSLIKHLLKEEG